MAVRLISEKEEEILSEICAKYGIQTALIEELLRIEKDYQLVGRRVGIFDKLISTIKKSSYEKEDQ